jgi:hypothetical protein
LFCRFNTTINQNLAKMKKSEFKKSLQSELKHANFIAKIETVTDVDVNTAIRFTSPVTKELAEWLNNRFSNGITLSPNTDLNLVFVNTPNQNNKGGKQAPAHTQGEWNLDSIKDGTIYSQDGKNICKAEKIEDAQRIVKAVNALTKMEAYHQSHGHKIDPKQDAILEFIYELIK